MSETYRLAKHKVLSDVVRYIGVSGVEAIKSYRLLVGPGGFHCLLAEPEDREWHLDLEPVVTELNRLFAEVQLLRMTSEERSAAGLAAYEVRDPDSPESSERNVASSLIVGYLKRTAGPEEPAICADPTQLGE